MRTRSLALRAIAFGVVLLLAARGGATAQSVNGGSTYSLFNIGDLQTGSSASVAGRAGVETAVPSPEILNSINPAAWGDLRYTTVQAALSFNQYHVSDASGSAAQNDTRIREFAFGLRWSEKLGGGLGIAIRPYSVVSYRTSQQQAVPGIDTTTVARVDYSGRGGISTARIGGSVHPFDGVAVGVTANLFFGTIATASDVSFPDGGVLLNPAAYVSTERYSGFSATIGVRVEPTKEILLASVVDLGSTLTRSRIATSSFDQGGQTIISRDTLPDGDVTIPTRISAGASWKTGRFLLAADWWTQAWSQSDFTTTRTASRFAFGVDRLASTSLNASGFERWTFRGGLFFEQTYYALPGGNIDAYGASLGLRWPITEASALNSSTVVDLAIEAGSRGTTTNGLTRETFGRLYFGVSLNELWFLRRR